MKNNTKRIATTAVVAALYAALTLALPILSYGPVQFRISEVMTLLPLIGKEYILGLTLGCFLANILGPYGVPDIIFGTLATFISVYLVYLTGKYMRDKKSTVLVASLWPVVVNAIIVGIQLNVFFGYPLFLSMLEVGLGQFVVVTIGGVILFKVVNNKYGKYLKNMF
ncbi:QueT transporter family protein [Romboutsia sp. 1001713B170207_170306_H8]|uniref:QueT transporter family protein n=1 Tax=Romboutsia sp. 1001713B170207_170306_H8 TaxID=2787112 RepID=UPI000821BDB2|nr:QueT transporter family protein [Romboutsia sp. 1001713B170207_170306_H8]SCI13383.1 Queuosine precursor ECF transporter S component QueT [uncultured Clostridium sp.]